MVVPINISKSKKQKRLIFYKSGFDKVTGYLMEFIILLALLMISTSLIFYELENQKRMILIIIILGLTLIVLTGIVFSILNNSKLKILSKLSEAKNKMDVQKIVELKNWKVLDEGINYKTILVADKWKGFHWGRYLTVIFSKNDMYLNVYATDLFGSCSPYHWFGNRKIEKEFITEIELLNN